MALGLQPGETPAPFGLDQESLARLGAQPVAAPLPEPAPVVNAGPTADLLAAAAAPPPQPPAVDTSLLQTPPAMPPPQEPQPIGPQGPPVDDALAQGMGALGLGQPATNPNEGRQPDFTQVAPLPAAPVATAPALPGQAAAPTQPPVTTGAATFEAAERLAASGLNREAAAISKQAEIDQRKALEEKAEIDRSNAAQEKLAAEKQKVIDDRNTGVAKYNGEIKTATDRWANYKIDEQRRWHNLSTGRKIAAGISVALSGLGDVLQRKSGPNMALELIQGAIKDDVQAQIREREGLKEVAAAKRNSLDDYLKSTGLAYEAVNMKEAEELKRTARNVRQIGAGFTGEEKKNQAEMLASQLELRAFALTDKLAQGRYDREWAKKQAAAAEAARRQQLGIEYARIAQADRHHRDSLALQMRGQDIQLAGMNAENERAAAALAAKGKTGQADQVREIGIAGLKNKDDQPFLAPDKETARPLRSKMASTAEAVDIINEVLSIRDRVGGESATMNSDDFQRLSMLQDRLNIIAKSGTEGLSSENDMKLLAGALGAKDIKSFRERTAGLEAGRNRAVQSLNLVLRANGYTGEAVKFPNMYEKTPEKTAEEAKFSAAVTKPSMSPEQALEQARKIAIDRIRKREGLDFDAKIPGKFNDEIRQEVKQAESGIEKGVVKITPQQRDDIRRMGDLATIVGPTGDAAFKRLRQLEQEGETAQIKAAASEALQRVGMSTTAPVRDDAGNTMRDEAGNVIRAQRAPAAYELPTRSATTASEAPAPSGGQ